VSILGGWPRDRVVDSTPSLLCLTASLLKSSLDYLKMASTNVSSEFPYSMYAHHPSQSHPQQIANSPVRTISLPLPTNRLASAALRAIEVDSELSPSVRRTMTLTAPNTPSAQAKQIATEEEKTVLETVYSATTHRMLRVSVNGFMESVNVVLGVMEELDVDVLREGDESMS
jgi:EKC/KEOPS complex subunit PCC1/LAGE3